MKLNKQQKQAVKYKDGPLLVIAGAGTGKTTVITERIKWLINKKGLSISEILGLTFTDKAATEMEERVDQALPLGYNQLWISTFHSFCDRVLKDEALHIGLDPNFKLMSEAESIMFFKDHLFDLELDYFRPTTNPEKFLSAVLKHLSQLRNQDISPKQYLEYAKKINKKTESEEEKLDAQKTLELAKIFKKYQKLKAEESVLDFGDLIGYTLKLFRERPNVLKEYQNKFKFILIDEFQDTNTAQYELIKFLAPPKTSPNLTVTGDDSQSIYKFRGAAISNILTFREDYHNSQTVTLIKNYRSTQTILDNAYQLIQHNNPDTLESKLGISKNLISNKKESGKKIQLYFENKDLDEAEKVVQEIKKLTKKKYDYKDVAILVRANNHADIFIQALNQRQIPNQFLGPEDLFRQKTIKILIAYLELLTNLTNDIAFFKVANLPQLKISNEILILLRGKAKKNNTSLFEIAKKSKNKNIKKLIKIIKQNLKLLSNNTGGQILYNFLELTNWLKILANPKNQTDQEQVLYISAFFDRIKAFESYNPDATVFDLLNWIKLKLELGESPQVTQTDWQNNNAVNILTVHSAKGLEFPVVFMANLVHLRFPGMDKKDKLPVPQSLIKEFLPQGNAHEQEERRLFYVAMTRAKERLYFTGARIYGDNKRAKKISNFVVEALGENEVETQTKHHAQTNPQINLPKPKSVTAVGAGFPCPPATNLNTLSHSHIETFSICPQQYKYKYILKLPSPGSASQTVGNIVHRTLKEFYQKQLLTGEKLKQKILLNILEQNWSSQGFTSKKQEKIAQKETTTMMKIYYNKQFAKNKIPNTVGLEYPFKIKIAPDLKIVGFIDRIDNLENNQIEIIDYKTGINIPTQKEVDKNRQLTIYALAVSQINDPKIKANIKDIKLSLYFLRENKILTTRRTDKQLETAKQEILETAEKIRKSSFKPNPNFMCKYCSYRLICDDWK